MRYLSILCMTSCLAIHAQRNTEPMEDHTPQDLMAQADQQRNTGWITMGAGAVGALAVAATGKMDSPRETAIVCGIFAAGCTFTLAFRASANAKDRQAMREMVANSSLQMRTDVPQLLRGPRSGYPRKRPYPPQYRQSQVELLPSSHLR